MRGLVVNCGPCPYLPDREFHAFQPIGENGIGKQYRDLMDLRFRRSGGQLYMPMCPGCSACQPVRVDVAAFNMRRDQRRYWKRNSDLHVSWKERGVDNERLNLYRSYQLLVHESKPAEPITEDFFTADAGVPGGELHARNGDGRLLAVSICDLFDDALSSVYCYYAADQDDRALGTFMALSELAFCRERHLRWWYLGFLVRGCAKMQYKSRFRPQEVLEDGVWVRYD
jgi:arginine-tRNA-protein transferase